MKTKVELIKEVLDPTMEQVEQAYIGQPNTCMCGCAGEYFTPEDNPKKVQMILDIVVAGTPENIEDYIFTRIINDRQYTIYLKRINR